MSVTIESEGQATIVVQTSTGNMNVILPIVETNVTVATITERVNVEVTPQMIVQGEGGNNSLVEITAEAGEDLGYPRAVTIENGIAFLFDPEVEANAYKTIGVTKNAASEGDSATIVLIGQFSTGNSILQGSIYYASANGVLTTTPPTGVIQKIGIAKTNDLLIVNMSTPFITI